MKYDLAVSIVVYHTDIDTLKKTIDSVLNSKLLVKVYVIDNSDTDAIGSLLVNYKNIDYIFNNNNLGYGKAHNIGIRKSLEEHTKYHVVLNPDVWFGDNVLEDLYNYMDLNDDIGNVMPKVLYGNKEEQYLCKLIPTPFDLIFRRFIPFKKLKEKRNEKYELRFSGYNKIMEVPILSGCFMFMRTQCLKDVGLFDERYFMYLEDVDLSRRIHQKYKTIFNPNVTIFHGYAKESYANPQLLKYHIRSAISYFNKWGWVFDSERLLSNKKILTKLDMGHAN